ncbi:hypothetical protein Leryth_025247 [Lithospermum erythrorhizon]|nr:hypothetical protein Leryth_025247 [Lithospermum erythrorhizon]
MTDEEEQLTTKVEQSDYDRPPIYHEALEQFEVFMNVITGPNTFFTFSLCGIVNKQAIHILVDIGSTNTFLDKTTAKHFNLPLISAPLDDNKPISHFISPGFEWKIQEHRFTFTVRILPLGACQMVVGVEWLQNHSLVQLN